MNKIIFKPEIFALLAAILNGTIGVLTRWAFNFSTTPATLAFWKCFLAFILIAIFCIFSNRLKREVVGLAQYWQKFVLLGFLGIFCLYFFETWAFNQASIPLVSFLTYAAGVITLLLSVIFLKEKITIYKIIAFFSIIAGVFFMLLFAKDVKGSLFGVVFALLGGLGYALFIFMSKILKVGSGIAQLFWLFLFGSLFLLVPWFMDGMQIPTSFVWIAIFCLVLLPTIGGFYFTTKAVELGEASKVQIIETSDPLFATLFAFVFFGDLLGFYGYIGALLIFIGLLASIK